jgi:catechol 2,3-dioxygenase-like lactoylglutathione lyase family enzyme
MSPVPGVRGGDHIGITVPDLDAAQRFFEDVLGAVHVFTMGEKRADETDWMATQLGVHPRTTIRQLRLLRLGDGLNIELFDYQAADGQAAQPRNSDLGGYHLAIYVDDIDAAVAYLRDVGVEVMGDPVTSAGPASGQRWVYFLAPWGLQLELVSYPAGRAYELDAPVRLWKPDYPD